MSNFEKIGVIFVTGLVAVILAMSFFGTGQDQLLTSRVTADERDVARADAEEEATSPPSLTAIRDRKDEPARDEGAAAGDASVGRWTPDVTEREDRTPAEKQGGLDALVDGWRNRRAPWEKAVEQEPVGSGVQFDAGHSLRADDPDRERTSRKDEPTGSDAKDPRAEGAPGADRREPRQIPERSPGDGDDARRTEPAKEAAPRRTYVVQPGDSLCGIAKRELGKEKYWTRIQKANPEVRPERLLVGTELVLPDLPEPEKKIVDKAVAKASPPKSPARDEGGKKASGRMHRVAPGESLIRIARNELKDAGKWEAILAMNRDRIRNADVLPVGLELRLPE